MGQPAGKLERRGSQLPGAIEFTSPWGTSTHLSKVRLRSSRMNVGLPVFTGFPLCASCPFEDTRRFFTKPEKDMRTWIRMAVSYVSKSKGLGRPCSSSNLITPWSTRSQQGPHKLRKVLSEDRCFFWEIPREGRREGGETLHSALSVGQLLSCRAYIVSAISQGRWIWSTHTKAIALPSFLCFVFPLAHVLLEIPRSTY